MSHIRGEPVNQEVVDIKLSYCSNSHVLPSYTVIMVLLINAVTRKECLQHCNIVLKLQGIFIEFICFPSQSTEFHLNMNQ